MVSWLQITSGRSPEECCWVVHKLSQCVSALLPLEVPHWSDNEFKIEKMRASGPGGQHVNKTETAVRITHMPTGITAVAQEERSQHLNRKLAMSRLNVLLRQKEN